MSNQPKPSKVPNFFWNIVAIIFVVLLIPILVLPNMTHLPVGRHKVTHFQIGAYKSILSQYYTDTGFYPSTSEGLKALVERPAGPAGEKWNGPYRTKGNFKDGWGRDFNYQCPGVHNPDTYDLWSYGADGKKGGKRIDADIGNW